VAERFDAWLNKAVKKHGSKYDYSKVAYIDAKTEVKIICPVHGVFEQVPDAHLTKGCRECANDELKGKYSKRYFDLLPEKKNVAAIVYYVKIQLAKKTLYKVGISVNSVAKRFSLATGNGIKIKEIAVKETTLFEAFEIEQKIQRLHGAKYRDHSKGLADTLRELYLGPTECFSRELTSYTINKYFCS
jgi:hypothetical protein